VGYKNVDRDCRVGVIDVYNEAGTVTLDQAFQATRVVSRSTSPGKPVTVTLSEDSISNILILSPPVQLTREDNRSKNKAGGFNALDVDFLKENQLVNALDQQQKEIFKDTLSHNLLDQSFLLNLLDIINSQLLAQDLLKNTAPGILPDYRANTGVVALVDDNTVTLIRDTGSDIQSVTVSKNQNTNIIQQQGSVEIKNRVNASGTTTITLKQN
jgi:hypothetical protein